MWEGGGAWGACDLSEEKCPLGDIFQLSSDTRCYEKHLILILAEKLKGNC